MKSVPLVMYKDGQRIVIGQAELKDDEHGIMVSASILPEYVPVLSPPVEDFSISAGPTFSSVTAQHARDYGAPLATPFSIAAWAAEVERVSNLDSPDA